MNNAKVDLKFIMNQNLINDLEHFFIENWFGANIYKCSKLLFWSWFLIKIQKKNEPYQFMSDLEQDLEIVRITTNHEWNSLKISQGIHFGT